MGNIPTRKPFRVKVSGCAAPLTIARRSVYPLLSGSNLQEFNELKLEAHRKKTFQVQETIGKRMCLLAAKVSQKELERRKNALEKESAERGLEEKELLLEDCEDKMHEISARAKEHVRQIGEKADAWREKSTGSAIVKSFIESEAGRALPEDAKNAVSETLRAVGAELESMGLIEPDIPFAEAFEGFQEEAESLKPYEVTREYLERKGVKAGWLMDVEAGKDFEAVASHEDWQQVAKTLGAMGRQDEGLEELLRLIAYNIAELRKLVGKENRAMESIGDIASISGINGYLKAGREEAARLFQNEIMNARNDLSINLKRLKTAIDMHVWTNEIARKIRKDLADYIDAAARYAGAQAERERLLERIGAIAIMDEKDGKHEACKARVEELKEMGKRIARLEELVTMQLRMMERRKRLAAKPKGVEEEQVPEKQSAFVYEKKNMEGKSKEALAQERLEKFISEAKTIFGKNHGKNNTMGENFEKTLKNIAKIYIENDFVLIAKMLEMGYPSRDRVKSQRLPEKHQRKYAIVRIAFDSHRRQRLLIDLQDAKNPQIIFVGMKGASDNYMKDGNFANYAPNDLFSHLKPE